MRIISVLDEFIRKEKFTNPIKSEELRNELFLDFDNFHQPKIKKDNYADKCSKEQQERKRLNLDELEDNVWDLQTELKNLHKNFISIQSDQEDEIGNAKTDEEKDNLAQKYGEKFNQVSKKQQDIKKKLVVAKNKLNKAKKEFDNFRDKL